MLAVVVALVTVWSIAGTANSASGISWVEQSTISFGGSVVCWIIMKSMWFVRVVLTDQKIALYNFFVQLEVPNYLISGVVWSSSVGIRLNSGRVLPCIGLGYSLAGEIAGFPTNRRCFTQIEEFLAESTDSEGPWSAPRLRLHLNLFFLVSTFLGFFIFASLV